VCEDAPRPIGEVNDHVPAWLIEIVDRLLAKNPDERYQSAEEVSELLEARLAQLQHPTHTPPTGTPHEQPVHRRPSRPRSSRHKLMATGAALLLLAAVFVVTEATHVTNVVRTVLRIEPAPGTLVIEVNDPNISIVITGEGGAISTVGSREIELKPGEYTVVASIGPDDASWTQTDLLRITSGNKTFFQAWLSPTATTETDTIKPPDIAIKPLDVDEYFGLDSILLRRIVDTANGELPAESLDQLISVIKQRLDPDGKLGIKVSGVGGRGIEVAVPEKHVWLLGHVSRILDSRGHLQLLILANKIDHKRLVQLAEKDTSGSRLVSDGENIVGKWVDVTPTPDDADRPSTRRDHIVDVHDCITREIPKALKSKRTLHADDVQVLVVVDPVPTRNIDQRHLASVKPGITEHGHCVDFAMNDSGAKLLENLTSANLPDEETMHRRRLGIILDDRLISAPNIMSTITEHGQITGNFFKSEVDFLVGVLRGGRLPLALLPGDREYAKLSPFAAVRFTKNDAIEVQLSTVSGEWLGLIDIGDVPIRKIIAFAKKTYGEEQRPSEGLPLWQKRFSEDLVEVLTRMGQPVGKNARFTVHYLDLGKRNVTLPMSRPWTEENRQGIRQANKALEKTPDITLVRRLTGHSGSVGQLAFLSDSRQVVSANGRSVRLWDCRTGIDAKLESHAGRVFIGLAVRPGGKRVAVGRSSLIKFYDLDQAKWTGSFPIETAAARLAYSSDGRRLFLAHTKIVTLWDVETRRELRRFDTADWQMASYSADGRFVATVDSDGNTHILNADTGAKVHVLDTELNPPIRTVFTPDGSQLVVMARGHGISARDNHVQVFDTATGKQLWSKEGHRDGSRSIAMSRRGEYFVTAGAFDNIVRIWQTATGRELATLHAAEGVGLALAISPDGRYLVSSGQAEGDHAIRVWKLPERLWSSDSVTSEFVLAISEDGTIHLNGTAKTRDEVQSALQQAVEDSSSDVISVVIRCHPKLPYQRAVEILDLCKQVGVNDVSLAVVDDAEKATPKKRTIPTNPDPATAPAKKP
jgi:WD40 repeat protein